MKTVLLVSLLLACALAWESFAPGTGPFDHMSNEEFARNYLMSADDAPIESPPVFETSEFESWCWIRREFDWRKSKKAKCIHPIRDQGKCGSCWAHATTEILSDRYCIETGDADTVFAPQYMVDCANSTWQAEGCNGAETQVILKWMEDFGMVTEQCYPYYSGTTESAGECHPNSCTSGDEWKNYKVAKGSTKLFFNYTNCEMATEIIRHGPIYFSMVVFDDFKAYKGGIYHPISYNVLGTHAVKCLGWGYDRKELSFFWICANSWTANWGENGFFRIGFNDFIGYKAGSARYDTKSAGQTPAEAIESILI